MKEDPEIQAVRDARTRLFESLGNDPRRVLEYFTERQKQYSKEQLITFDVNSDEIIGLQKSGNGAGKPSTKFPRCFSRIESLPPSQQKTALRSIDMFLRGAVGA